MHPELANFGFVHLKTYGALVAVGFLLCWKLIEKLSGRNDLSNFILSLMVAGIVGARAAYVIENWQSQFAFRPFDVLRIDQGGLVFYGGLVLAIAVFFGWCIIKKESPAALGDLFCAAIPLGHAFGRIGCFFYGCCYGKRSASALAVCFPVHSPAWHEQIAAGELPRTATCSLPVLPAQLFEAAALLILFAIVFLLYRKLYAAKTRVYAHGMVAGAYLMGYSAIRFALEYLRGDPRAQVGPLSIAQTISFAIFALGVLFIAVPLALKKKGAPK